MRRGTLLWRTIGFISLVSTLLFLCGFGIALKDIIAPSDRTPFYADNEAESGSGSGAGASQVIRVTALGDSLTKGTGDSKGEGYVKQSVKLMEDKYDKPVKLMNNLAINGLRADQLNDKLTNDKGFRLAVSEADIILMTIGGNDLFQYAQGQGEEEGDDEDVQRSAGRSGELSLEELQENMTEGVKRLEHTIDLLNEINPKARVVYVGLYNPFYDVEDLRDGSIQVQEWNRQVYAVIHRYPNMRLVPTFDLFEANISRYLSSDHFHPNHEGYSAIAERIVQSLD
ncbi:GDSL-type esterase/lipase family protein [Paenibacillus kobensis]|uniref:GDSL-type esterase/lipase family protein n=1 Tax=Paenibacillus kobensis TaxID=59841 RepID=UPI000FD6F291|nr:GDSL-type esterase/lipase family protein [Paenibacillus kobensis]